MHRNAFFLNTSVPLISISWKKSCCFIYREMLHTSNNHVFISGDAFIYLCYSYSERHFFNLKDKNKSQCPHNNSKVTAVTVKNILNFFICFSKIIVLLYNFKFIWVLGTIHFVGWIMTSKCEVGLNPRTYECCYPLNKELQVNWLNLSSLWQNPWQTT